MSDADATPGRIFVATTDTVMVVVMTDAMSKALDVLDAAGMMNEKAVNLVYLSEKTGDPVAFAHKLVSLVSVVHEWNHPNIGSEP